MTFMDRAMPASHKPTNEELYEKQMRMLQMFLERKAISQEQYDVSTRDLDLKMGIRTGRTPV